MNLERIARPIAATFLLLATSGIARAQCLEFAPGFGLQGGGLSSPPEAQVVFDDGTGPALYVAGRFSIAGNLTVQNIAKWDGTSWSSLGQGLGGWVHALTVFDDGTGPALYVSGNFPPSGAGLNFVARWDGTAWSDVGGGLHSGGGPMTVFDDGSGPALYIGGSRNELPQSPQIVRWDGSSWSAPGTGASPHTLLSLQGYDDGNGPKLYAGNGFGVRRLDGSVWSSYLGGEGGSAECMVVFDDGSGSALYVGGTMFSLSCIRKWNGTGWSNVGAGITTTYGGGLNGLAVYDDGSGVKLYAGGRFTSAGGAPASHLAAWDGASWTAIPGWSQSAFGVTSLAAFDDGTGPVLHVGGEILVAGPVLSRGIARWDGTAWNAMSNVPYAYEGVVGGIYALATFDDGTGEALYACNESMIVAGSTPAQGIARWNGTSWSAVGGGLLGDIRTMKAADDGTGPALFVGGQISMAGGSPANNVVKWDGQAWSVLGAPGGTVLALEVYDSGSGPKLYAGGLVAGGIKVWDGASWISHPAGSLDSNVSCMTVHNDGTGPALYVAGKFTRANGTIATQRIAKWKGGAWIPLGCGLGVGDSTNNEYVAALETFDFGNGPELVAGGWFTRAGCAYSPNVARWNGSSWSPLDEMDPVTCLLEFDDGGGSALYAGSPNNQGLVRWNGSGWTPVGPTSSVRALASFENVPSGGPDLFVGGGFLSAGGVVSIGIAQWRGCAGGPGTKYCFGDGSGLWCPCSNNGLPGHGCQNSEATGGATLAATGRRHPDTVVLASAGERPTSLSIFLQGNASIGPVNYGDGLRCAGGALKRLYTKTANGGQISAPQPGDLSITARSAQAGDPIQLGSTRYYQTYYRDGTASFCPSPAGSTFNSTNGIRIEW